MQDNRLIGTTHAIESGSQPLSSMSLTTTPTKLKHLLERSTRGHTNTCPSTRLKLNHRPKAVQCFMKPTITPTEKPAIPPSQPVELQIRESARQTNPPKYLIESIDTQDWCQKLVTPSAMAADNACKVWKCSSWSCQKIVKRVCSPLAPSLSDNKRSTVRRLDQSKSFLLSKAAKTTPRTRHSIWQSTFLANEPTPRKTLGELGRGSELKGVV